MSQLFTSIVRPLATAQTPGALLGGVRGMSVDGTVFDIPDTDANARVLGYPSTRSGPRSAFPKARLVILVEAGTHLIPAALMCPYRIAERVRAIKLLRSVSEGMRLMWDRRLPSYKLVNATLNQKSHRLGRVPAKGKCERVPECAAGSYLVVPEKLKDQVKSGISAEKHWLKIARKYSNSCKTWGKQGFLASLKDLFFRDAPVHLTQI